MNTDEKFTRIGYWYVLEFDPQDLRAPPLRSDGPDPHDFVDPTWDREERALVVAHLRAGKVNEGWRGFSWCRMRCGCDASEMGSHDLTDGVFVWPEGYAHYIEKHDVKPPREFIEHVLAK